MKDHIPTTLISDNMAGAIMRQGKIDAVIVGADRIAANAMSPTKLNLHGRGAGQRAQYSLLRGGAILTIDWKRRMAARFRSSNDLPGSDSSSGQADRPDG